MDAFELEEFDSDDGEHHVVWKLGEKGYPTWICVTHDKDYYHVCAKA